MGVYNTDAPPILHLISSKGLSMISEGAYSSRNHIIPTLQMCLDKLLSTVFLIVSIIIVG